MKLDNIFKKTVFKLYSTIQNIRSHKIISNNEVYIETLEKSLIKEKRKVKLFKSGFTISTIACSVLLVLHLIN